jgi:hypothetical protein
MADTNHTNRENRPPDENEVAKEEISSEKLGEQETIGAPQATSEMEKEKGFFGDVAGNIGEGAKMVGEKGTELADLIVHKLKRGLSQAYEAGAKVVDELSQAAQEYAEKYKAESKMKKVNGEKDKLMIQLGQSIFRHHLAGGNFTEAFFNKEEIVEQFNQIEVLDKEIVETGKQLDKG